MKGPVQALVVLPVFNVNGQVKADPFPVRQHVDHEDTNVERLVGLAHVEAAFASRHRHKEPAAQGSVPLNLLTENGEGGQLPPDGSTMGELFHVKMLELEPFPGLQAR